MTFVSGIFKYREAVMKINFSFLEFYVPFHVANRVKKKKMKIRKRNKRGKKFLFFVLALLLFGLRVRL
jgi:hypothetical protein